MSDEKINRERVRQEAEKHKGPPVPPEEKARDEARHRAAKYRVLPRTDKDSEPEDPEVIRRRLREEQGEADSKGATAVQE